MGREEGVELVASVVGVELVIFDCDGVLVDSEAISNRVLAAMLTEQGLPTTLPQARSEYGSSRHPVVNLAGSRASART